MTTETTPYESRPAEECCPSIATPIGECHRSDVVAWEREAGANLFCPCCGRFWKGSDADVEKAAREFAEYEASLQEDNSL